jgi:hypothetical protein
MRDRFQRFTSRFAVRNKFARQFAAAAALLLLAGPAYPQVNAPTLQKPDPDAKQNTSPTMPSTGESLSEKLDKSGGVIQPPAGVDPQINLPAKDPGVGSSMPVIRPPGSPGGDQSVQPK